MKKLVLLLSAIIGLCSPIAVVAATKPQPPYWQWISPTSIELVTSNSNNPFHMQNGNFVSLSGSCPYVVVNSNISSATLYTNQGSIDGSCDVAQSITLNNVSASGYKPFDPNAQAPKWPEYWYWLSNGQLNYHGDLSEVPYQENSGHFISQTGASCPYVDVQASDPGSGVYHDGANCANATHIAIFQTNNAQIPASSADGSGSTSAPDVCTNASGAFSWLVCPLTTTIQKYFIQPMYNDIVVPLLSTEPIGNDTTLKAVWKSFLTVADIFFVIAFLVIIFGSALSLDIDAYTIKKALPRLVMAAIFIQFSFFICEVVVDFGNILGHGLLDLIFTALQSSGAASGSGPGWSHILSGVLGTGLLVGGAVATVAFAGFGLLIMFVGVAVSIVTFLITLVVRQMLIYMLVVLSPLAFVAWILPNTEKLFKMWWQNFVKLIMMYPLIALLIGAGYIMQTAVGHNSTSSAVAQLLGILAPTIVFFMMPMTFKMAGGAMSMTGGAISRIGGRGRKAAMEGTKGMVDRSAKLKQRKYDRENKWLGAAQGSGVKARYAQRRLGMGWASTENTVAQINALKDKREKEALSARQRQLADMQPDYELTADGKPKIDANGNRVVAKAEDGAEKTRAWKLKQLALGQSVDGIAATGDMQYAAMTELTKIQATSELRAIKAVKDQGGEDTVMHRVLSDNFEKLKDAAPDLVGRPMSSLNRDAIAKLDEGGMEAYMTWAAKNNQTSAAIKNLYDITQDSVLSRTANVRGMAKARDIVEKGEFATAGISPAEVTSIKSRVATSGIIRPANTAPAPAIAGPGGAPIVIDEEGDGDAHV